MIPWMALHQLRCVVFISYCKVLFAVASGNKFSIPAAACILLGTHIDLRDDPYTLRNLAGKKQQMLTPGDGTTLAQKTNTAIYLECSSKTLVSPYTNNRDI